MNDFVGGTSDHSEAILEGCRLRRCAALLLPRFGGPDAARARETSGGCLVHHPAARFVATVRRGRWRILRHSRQIRRHTQPRRLPRR